MLVVSGLVVCLLLIITVILVARKSARPDPGRRPARAPNTAAPETSAAAGPVPLYNSESQREHILTFYPALKATNYIHFAEGATPTALKDIAADLRKGIEERVALIKPMPTASLTLLNLLRNPESDSREVSSIVLTNPVFSAKILQSVNSAYFGLSEKITSAGRAITLLGYNNVRSLVCQDALSTVVPAARSLDRDAYTKTWIHSAVVSVCAGYLGKQLFQYHGYDLATIGLLHDIGKYFLQDPEVKDGGDESKPTVIREEETQGINHAALGGLIAAGWELSSSISEGIEFHHHPVFLPPDSLPEQIVKQGFVVCLADLISNVLGYSASTGGELLPIREEYYRIFGVNPDLSGIISPLLLKEIEKARLTVDSYSHATAKGA
jgi:HD-like signal output (HDOD) protein